MQWNYCMILCLLLCLVVSCSNNPKAPREVWISNILANHQDFMNVQVKIIGIVQDIQVLQRVQVYFRIGGGLFGSWSAFTHDQFTRINADRFMLKNEFKCPGPLNRYGVSYGGNFSVKPGNQHSSFS